MHLHIRPYTPADKAALIPCIQGLYAADAAGHEITLDKIERTLRHFTAYPEKGAILVMEMGGQLVGYGMLVHYWSNEYGGTIVFIDELYVRPEHQGQGLGSRFLQHLIEVQYPEAVAFSMEVMPSNRRAEELYLRLGFQHDGRSHLIFERK